MADDGGQVTQLLKAMRSGDPQAAQDLLPLVYAELHRLAKSYMRRERPDHTLQATALINEAYLRLAGEEIDWKNRAHFIGLSAQVMRRVLVDHARAHNAEQRGGGLQRVEMQDELAISPDKLDQVQQIDDLLKKLEKENPRQAKVVELRYFGGLNFRRNCWITQTYFPNGKDRLGFSENLAARATPARRQARRRTIGID